MGSFGSPKTLRSVKTGGCGGYRDDLGFVQTHNLTRLRNLINQKYSERLETYHDLHKWSVEHYDKFWSEVWDLTGIVSSVKSEVSVDTLTPMNEIPRWFPEARLNYAENLLR